MQHGHPPYRLDLNPIELVWGEIKGEVAHQNIGWSLENKEQLLWKLFSEYLPEKWKKVPRTWKKD